MSYDEDIKELNRLDISIKKMTEALEKFAESIKGKEIFRKLRERSVEEKISSWEGRLENLQKENMPLILQRACMESILKFMMEKIHKDHCQL